MPKVPYSKPFLSYRDQVALLVDKGLAVPDQEDAADKLRRYGYYRLSGYWYTFKAPRTSTSSGPGSMMPGYSFEHAVRLYEFDRTFRLMIMDAVERVEIAMRHEIAYQLGSIDPFAQHRMSLFTPKFWNERKPVWDAREVSNLKRSRELFAAHYKHKHSLPMPIWISVEIWDFGMLSTLFDGLVFKRQRSISQAFAISNPKVLGNWLRSINQLRNVCAHHGRVWNKIYTERLSAPSPEECPRFSHVLVTEDTWNNVSNTVYAPLLALRHLTDCINGGSSDWSERVAGHLGSFPSVPGHDISLMGIPAAWDQSGNWG